MQGAVTSTIKIRPPMYAPNPAETCCTAELALMNPPRNRLSTLAVIIDRAAVMRPALLTMSNPTTPTASASGTGGRLVTTTIKQAETDRDDPKHGQLSEPVGQHSDQRCTDERQYSAGQEDEPEILFGHAHIRHERQADVGNHRETAEHHGSRQPEGNQVLGRPKVSTT